MACPRAEFFPAKESVAAKHIGQNGRRELTDANARLLMTGLRNLFKEIRESIPDESAEEWRMRAISIRQPFAEMVIR